MKKLVLSVVLGATLISTQAGAQTAPADSGGGKSREISRQQAQQFADSMFQRFDLNHDGTITRDEAEQARSQIAGASGHGGGRAERMIDKLFGTAQAVDKSQFEAIALARFDKQDADHNGVVTPSERHQSRSGGQAPQ
jgi:Ca2+-binding EF-hand superfamily protein